MKQIDKASYAKSIADLKNVENFNQETKHNALKHIFEGEINTKTG